jgi:hypothetical protein
MHKIQKAVRPPHFACARENAESTGAIGHDSPQQLQSKLHLPRACCCRRDYARRRRRIASGGRVHHGIRCIEIRVVEQVEDLRSELQPEAFRQQESTRHGKVRFIEIRSLQCVSSDIAVCTSQRLKERVRIEILIGPTLDDRSRKIGIYGRAHGIARVTVVRRVIGKLRRKR